MSPIINTTLLRTDSPSAAAATQPDTPPPSPLAPRSEPSSSRIERLGSETHYDAFLSHAWHTDSLGRDNHARVAAVNCALQEAGLVTWFDEQRMHGKTDMNALIARSIEKSAVVVVFITHEYLLKASGLGQRGEDDVCKYEFDCALLERGLANIVAVVMEPGLRNPSDWVRGTVHGKCGGRFYYDLADDATHCKGLQRLIDDLYARRYDDDQVHSRFSRMAASSHLTARCAEPVSSIDSDAVPQITMGRPPSFPLGPSSPTTLCVTVRPVPGSSNWIVTPPALDADSSPRLDFIPSEPPVLALPEFDEGPVVPHQCQVGKRPWTRKLKMLVKGLRFCPGRRERQRSADDEERTPFSTPNIERRGHRRCASA